jgi:hypothetical protein
VEIRQQSATIVREVVARADARRRARAAVRRVGQAAPVAAGAGLVTAFAARFFALPAVLPLSVLGAFAVLFAAYVIAARRSRDVSDADVARIDAESGLGGELRSAHWFAARAGADQDEWETLHLDRAAANAAAVTWERLYPPVRAARTWATTAVLVTGALVVTASGFTRHAASTTAVSRGTADDGDPTLVVLPEELRKRLADLLAAIEKGKLSGDKARAEVADLRELMDKVDPSLSASLADFAKRAADAAVVDGNKGHKADDAKTLADRAEQAAESAQNLPQDVRWSLDNLASRLANAAERQKSQSSAASATQSENQQGQPGAGSLSDAVKGGLVVREAAADPGGEMTMAGAGQASGDTRPGGGGNKGGPGRGKLLDIEKALRRETVEASSDTTGANVIAEIHRKTEAGQAKVAFTRTAVPSTFSPSHATPPPAVPEDRRALLFSYFIRRQ